MGPVSAGKEVRARPERDLKEVRAFGGTLQATPKEITEAKASGKSEQIRGH